MRCGGGWYEGNEINMLFLFSLSVISFGCLCLFSSFCVPFRSCWASWAASYVLFDIGGNSLLYRDNRLLSKRISGGFISRTDLMSSDLN